MSSTRPGPSIEPRPSACADAAREAQAMRLRAMTALERMALALRLGRRCRMLAEAMREREAKDK